MSLKAIDCHAHIIDPSMFPYEDGPGYKPASHESGTQSTYIDALDYAGIAHALLVQPSCYGYDNSALLDTMQRFPGRFRAISMVPPTVSDTTLDIQARAGVVGVRFNLVSYDSDIFRKDGVGALLHRMRAIGWFAEVVADPDHWRRDADLLLGSEVRLLVDHFGMHGLAAGVDAPGFQAVLDIGRSSDAVVKLTTPFSLGLSRREHGRLQPFVEALLEAYGIERCVWGSDWPFLTVPDPPDMTEAMRFLEEWVPDPVDRQRVLWTNPARLFGFGDSDK